MGTRQYQDNYTATGHEKHVSDKERVNKALITNMAKTAVENKTKAKENEIMTSKIAYENLLLAQTKKEAMDMFAGLNAKQKEIELQQNMLAKLVEMSMASIAPPLPPSPGMMGGGGMMPPDMGGGMMPPDMMGGGGMMPPPEMMGGGMPPVPTY